MRAFTLDGFGAEPALRDDIPEPLERIVLKAMDRNPRDRYKSAAAFAEDLKRWRSGQDVEAKPKRFWKF